MENNILNIIKRANESVVDFLVYSRFVNDVEFYAFQNPNYFPDDYACEVYAEKWSELEIINALMLCDWEELNKPQNFSEIWNKKYKDDAHEVIQEFIAYLNDLNIQ